MSPVPLCLQLKLTSFLTTGYTRKHRPMIKNFKTKDNNAS